MFVVASRFGAGNRVYRLERSCDKREQLCGDRADDDCDGLVDCDDVDCAGDTSCAGGGLCRPTTVIACGATVSGDTRRGSWRIDSYRGGTRAETGPEVAYTFTASFSVSGTVTVALSGFANDLDLLVVPAAPAGGCAPTRAAIAASSTTSASETASFAASANTTYFIVVDGYQRAYSQFHLDVTCN